jgi:hypothetical protein
MRGGYDVYKVMAFLATRRGIAMVALSAGMAALNAKCGRPIGMGDYGW